MVVNHFRFGGDHRHSKEKDRLYTAASSYAVETDHPLGTCVPLVGSSRPGWCSLLVYFLSRMQPLTVCFESHAVLK